MAPLIQSCHGDENYSPIVVLTGQHPTMAKEVLNWFGISPDFEYQVDRTDNSLNGLVSQLTGIAADGLNQTQPDLVVVQGDTATAFAGALAAFNLQIPVAHLEAGLRTNDVSSPFPEEAYRQMISRISVLNMCPTQSNKINLLQEGLPEESIMVTGNTVVDAFSEVQEKLLAGQIKIELPLNLPDKNLVLVTAHRRENLEHGIREIAEAISELAMEFEHLNFVIPLHPNPAVRARITPLLESRENVLLLEPLDYPEFITILSKSIFVLTDSGGVQEEAPILGVPALVMRENTERPEGVDSGGVLLVGANKFQIVNLVRKLMTQEKMLTKMSKSSNPYGDGMASRRCLSMVDEYFGFGRRTSEFINAE